MTTAPHNSLPATPSSSVDDIQASRPATEISLTRVGVRGVEKVIRVAAGTEPGHHFFAELECYVDLDPAQAGAHMSRFEEVINEAIDETVLGETMRAEELAAMIAVRIRERQEALRAEVKLRARYPETVDAPDSGIPTQEIYTLFGTAVASEAVVRTLTGVEAQGMTACPCAQQLLVGRSRERLKADGFTDEQIDLIFHDVPVATHNQRGIGAIHIGRPENSGVDVDARDLLAIVEQSMSSEIYELMKRSDEAFVVEKAHMHPRFVEDCVREMLRRVVERYPDLVDGGFVFARQENLETIHRHTVLAERSGLLSEVADELRTGNRSVNHLSAEDWLHA